MPEVGDCGGGWGSAVERSGAIGLAGEEVGPVAGGGESCAVGVLVAIFYGGLGIFLEEVAEDLV